MANGQSKWSIWPKNSKDIILGVADRDTSLLFKGTKGIAKTVIIGSIAVGVVDVMNGIDRVAVATETEHSTDLSLII